VTRQRKRDRQPARNGNDNGRPNLTVDLTRRDLETAGRSFLGVVDLADQIDDSDGSVLDVTAAGA
jgi:hypothetical protein